MSDLISRQALLNAIFQKEYGHDYDENTDILGLKYVDIINWMPSVEPERKTGKWVWNKRTGEYVCSECGCNPVYEGMTPDESEIDKYRFCRWCGSKMEVEE